MNNLDYDQLKPSIALIGKVLRPHGNKGEIRVLPYSNAAEDLLQLEAKEFFLLQCQKKWIDKITLEATRVHQGVVLFKFKEINSLAEANSVKGAEIGIRSEERWELPENHYYQDQLIGLDVIDLNSKALLGKIKDVVYGVGNDFLALDYKGKEVLIPAVKGCVIEVNLQQSYVKVHLPQGLLDIF